ncbi:inositol monophosphatase family protein [Oligella urethralis]|uniref:Inositol-1-monophosphatase n=1 Tax=Oligella urethralis DNF00040 TaxID=1401065 RepID=A0A095ZBM0_9BURK|nr:inositol monophosphatase family protein [Oligella urethralis]KGF32170.1 inositol phosphatase [Oligella urethralis DNF00040]
MQDFKVDFYHALETATSAAKEAASILNIYAQDHSKLSISYKSRNDLVSQADKDSEQAILQVVRERTPEIAIVAEESGTSANLDESQYTWFIDPLDGTTNFLHGIPHYAVSIGLVARAGTVLIPNTPPLEVNTPILGVVYDPNRQEMFSAIYQDGCFLNGQRIYTSQAKHLEDALLATGVPFRDFSFEAPYMRGFKEVMHHTRGIRRLGSAALDLAWVACGRFDGYWEMGLAPYDVCAGTILVREAGGTVSDIYEKEPWPQSGNIIASTKSIEEDFGNLIRQQL